MIAIAQAVLEDFYKGSDIGRGLPRSSNTLIDCYSNGLVGSFIGTVSADLRLRDALAELSH